MRTLSLIALFLLAAAGWAAPALGDKPKWEYAELTYRNIPARPGGVTADGTEVEPTPASVTVRWITGSGEVEVKGWAELAEKLKAPGFKKDGSPALQKIQILNCLGGEGWELLEQLSPTPLSARGGPAGQFPGAGPMASSPASGSWLLKRRVP